MKQRRFTFIHMLTAVLAGILATLLVLWLLLGSQSVSLLTAWGAVRTRFVGEYDPDTAMDSALRGMVAGLGDRWSYYLNAEESAYQREREDNRYVGIGVTAGKEDERGLFLLQVYSGGPAEEAGLKVGEVITAVDGVSAAGERAGKRPGGHQGRGGHRGHPHCNGRRREVPGGAGHPPGHPGAAGAL